MRSCTASRTLRAIRENATPKQRDYVDRFFGDGESVSCIAERSGVSPSTVSHTIRDAVSAAGEWLEEHLPKEALRSGKEPEQQPETVRRLHMSESEIAVRYRQARNKAVQIGILADLNVTTKDVIREVLRENGFDIPEPAKKHGRSPQRATPLCVAAAKAIEKKTPKGGRRKWPDPPMAPMLDVEHEKNKEERPVAKNDAKAMDLDVLAEIAKNVKATFLDVEVHMAAGMPGGMVLTVRWDAKGDVTDSALQIEAVDR